MKQKSKFEYSWWSSRSKTQTKLKLQIDRKIHAHIVITDNSNYSLSCNIKTYSCFRKCLITIDFYITKPKQNPKRAEIIQSY